MQSKADAVDLSLSTTRKHRPLRSFLEFLSELFPPVQIQRGSLNAAMVRLVLTYLWWLLQMMLFLERQRTTEKNTVVDGFWLAISCIRPDSLLSAISSAQIWFYIACFVSLTSCLGLTFLYLERQLQVKQSKGVLMLLRVCTQLIAETLEIPCANGILVVWFENERFGNGIEEGTKVWGKPLAVPMYILFVAYLGVVYLATFDFDIHLNPHFAKSELTQDLCSLGLTQLTLFSYYLLSPASYALHLTLVLVSSSLTTLRHLRQLPYYNPLCNLLFIWTRGAVAGSSVAMLVGYFVDSALCGFWLMLTLSISWLLVLLLAFDGYCADRLAGKSRHIRELYHASERELGLRKFLSLAFCGEDKSQRVSHGQIAVSHIDYFLKMTRKEDRAQLLVLKHLVLMHSFGNERAARMCLSQADALARPLMELWSVVKCETALKGSRTLEEVQFLQYLHEISIIKKKDEYVCSELTEVWSELGSIRPNISRVKSLSLKVERDIRYLKSAFSRVAKDFPGSFEMYELYASFQEEVLSQAEKAKPLRAKANSYNKTFTLNKEEVDSLGFFDSSTCVLIVDLRPATFLEILYRSKLAATMLDFDPKENAHTTKLTALIPPPYCDLHGKKIPEFMKEVVMLEVSHPSQIPLITYKGKLIFCVAKIIFSSSASHPVLAIAFKPLHSLQEGAILSDDLTIESHSASLHFLIGAKDPDLKGRKLDEIRPSIARLRNPAGMSPCFLIFRNQPYCGMFLVSMFGQKRINFFFAFKTGKNSPDRECQKWNLAVNDARSSLFQSSTVEDYRRGSVYFPTDINLIPATEKDEIAPNKSAESMHSRHPASSYKESSTGDIIMREREMLKYKVMMRDGLHICTLIVLLTVSVTQVALLLVLNVAAVVVVKSQVNAIISTNMIDRVAAKQIFTGQLAFCVRVLTLPIITPGTKTLFEASLRQFLSALEAVHSDIWSEIDQSQSQEYENFMLNSNVITWELMEGEIVIVKRTVIDAIQKLIDEVGSTQTWKFLSANTTMAQQAVFYVVRNGLGETYEALDSAKSLFLKSSKASISSSIEVYFIYLLIAICITTASTVSVLPVISKLHISAKGVSKLLLCNPVHTYYEEKQRLIERLQQRYEVELDPAIEHPFRGERKNSKLYHPAIYITVTLLLLWLVVLCFYLPLYFEVFNALAEELQVNPSVLAYDSTRLVKLLETDLWVSEAYLNMIGCPMAQLVPQYLKAASPSVKVAETLQGIKRASSELLSLVLTQFRINSEHFQFLYASTNFTSPLFRNGYRVGTKTLINEILYCFHEISLEGLGTLTSLYNTVMELAINAYTISDFYMADCAEIVHSSIQDIQTMLVGYSVGLVVCGVAVVWVVNYRTYRVGRALLKLSSTMVPPRPKERTIKASTIDCS